MNLDLKHRKENKFMKAPEKLYVDTEDDLSDSILYGFTEKRKEDDIEYIRTDVFIKKFEEWIKNVYSETDYRFKEDFTGMLINNFKNYMKE